MRMKIKSLSRKKRFIILSVALACLLAGSGIAYISFKSKSQMPAVSPTELVRKETTSLVANKDYDGALAVWNEFLATNPPAEDQAEAYQEIAAIQQNKQDLPAALAAYRQAETASEQPSLNTVLHVAALSEDKGDKVTAREYYQKAIGLLDPASPMYQTEKNDFEEKVRELQ